MPSDRGGTYQRIADDLLARIRSGEFRPGDRLPAASKLLATYGVSKTTVAAALDVLRASGLVVTRQGSGAYVRETSEVRRSSPERLSRDRWGRGRSIQDADAPGRTRVVDIVVALAAAPDWVAAALGVDTGADVLARSRRFLVDERPMQLATSWYPVDVVAGTRIMLTDTGPGGAYQRLTELGHAPTRFTEQVRTRMPVADEARDLALPAGTPILEVTRHAYTEAGRCVESTRMVLDGSAYTLDYTFDA
ncbi:MAG TPA: GntR family transcriptional regulator [Actinocatenispora sp.]